MATEFCQSKVSDQTGKQAASTFSSNRSLFLLAVYIFAIYMPLSVSKSTAPLILRLDFTITGYFLITSSSLSSIMPSPSLADYIKTACLILCRRKKKRTVIPNIFKYNSSLAKAAACPCCLYNSMRLPAC